MAEFTVPPNGTICWRELATSDPDAAADFYNELFGWKIEQSKITDMKYSEIHIDGKAVGGIMPIDKNWGDMPSAWTTYIAVDNADKVADAIRTNGGSIRVEPFDAPGVGRMALASDPSGVGFAIIQLAAPGA